MTDMDATFRARLEAARLRLTRCSEMVLGAGGLEARDAWRQLNLVLAELKKARDEVRRLRDVVAAVYTARVVEDAYGLGGEGGEEDGG